MHLTCDVGAKVLHKPDRSLLFFSEPNSTLNRAISREKQPKRHERRATQITPKFWVIIIIKLTHHHNMLAIKSSRASTNENECALAI